MFHADRPYVTGEKILTTTAAAMDQTQAARMTANTLPSRYKRCYTKLLNKPEFLTQLTLDASKVIDIKKLCEEQLGSLELYTREYIYRIHIKIIDTLRQSSDWR